MQFMKLTEFPKDKFKRFLESFKVILTDCNGVLWAEHGPLEGAVEVLRKFESLGKKTVYLTNSTTRKRSAITDYLNELQFPKVVIQMILKLIS